MARFKRDSSFDLDFSNSSTTHPIILPECKPKIRPLVLHKGVSPHQRDYIRQKRVRNYKALKEEESYPEQLSFVRRENFCLNKSHYQKETRNLSIMFLSIDVLLKVMKHIPSKYPSLTAINVAFKEIVKKDSLVRISRYISRFSRLKALKLNFYQRQLKFKDNGLLDMEKSLSKLKRLVDVNLSFTENKIYLFKAGLVPVGSIFDEKDQNLRIFPSLFSRLTNLTTLNLTLMEQNTLTGGELVKFSNKLQELRNLTSLYLNFLDCRSLYFKDIDKLLTGLVPLKQLNIFGLAFTVFENVGKGRDTPSLHPIWQLENISRTNLEIKFIAVFSSEIMDTLIDSVSKIKSLEKLTLAFHRCQLTEDKKIKALISSLAILPKLYHLDLGFVFCQSLIASTASCIMYDIAAMPSLQTTNIKFQSCFRRILGNSEEIKDFIVEATNLTKLTLDFVDCQGLDDQQIFEMTNLIKMSPKLKELNVGLNWCKIASDKHVQEIIRATSSLQCLEYLSLGFQGCHNVTRNSFSEFKMLRSLCFLRYLDINISHWLGIADKDLEVLGKSLSYLKNLEDLKIGFQQCKDVTDSGVQQMCEYFVRLHRLNGLTLSWNSMNLKEASKNIVPSLEKDLSKLSYIQLHSASTKMWIWLND